jgi:curved DNA-binding protein CbpA
MAATKAPQLDGCRACAYLPIEMVTRDHYLVLGVSRTAPQPEIRSAYKLRALERHPDHAGPGGAGEFQRLADAYRVLADPVRRAAYDAELRRIEARPRGPVMDLRRGPPRAPAAEPLVPQQSRPWWLRELDEPHDAFEETFGELLRLWFRIVR